MMIIYCWAWLALFVIAPVMTSACRSPLGAKPPQAPEIRLLDPESYYDYRWNQHDIDGCTSMDNVQAIGNRIKLNATLYEPCTEYRLASKISSFVITYNAIAFADAAENTKQSSNEVVDPAVRNCDVSLTVQTSLSRLPVFENLAEYWTGPIVLAFYGPDSDVLQLKSFIEIRSTLFTRSNIVYHHVKRREANFDYKSNNAIYPVNLLRNVAITTVQTPFYFTDDIDYIPRDGLYERLVHKHLPELYNCQSGGELPKVALVVPTFMSELESANWKDQVPRTKQGLIKLWKPISGGNPSILSGSPPPTFPQGQAATDYDFWKDATQPYHVPWAPSYEPLVVLPTNSSPLFDNLLLWPFDDHYSFVMELQLQKFHLLVLPDEYIVHLHHKAGNRDLTKWAGICRGYLQTIFYQKLQKRYGQLATNLISSIVRVCYSIIEAKGACLCAT